MLIIAWGNVIVNIDKIANACIYNIKVGGNDAEIIEIAHELKDIFLKDN